MFVNNTSKRGKTELFKYGDRFLSITDLLKNSWVVNCLEKGINLRIPTR